MSNDYLTDIGFCVPYYALYPISMISTCAVFASFVWAYNHIRHESVKTRLEKGDNSVLTIEEQRNLSDRYCEAANNAIIESQNRIDRALISDDLLSILMQYMGEKHVSQPKIEVIESTADKEEKKEDKATEMDSEVKALEPGWKVIYLWEWTQIHNTRLVDRCNLVLWLYWAIRNVFNVLSTVICVLYYIDFAAVYQSKQKRYYYIVFLLLYHPWLKMGFLCLPFEYIYRLITDYTFDLNMPTNLYSQLTRFWTISLYFDGFVCLLFILISLPLWFFGGLVIFPITVICLLFAIVFWNGLNKELCNANGVRIKPDLKRYLVWQCRVAVSWLALIMFVFIHFLSSTFVVNGLNWQTSIQNGFRGNFCETNHFDYGDWKAWILLFTWLLF